MKITLFLFKSFCGLIYHSEDKNKTKMIQAQLRAAVDRLGRLIASMNEIDTSVFS